MWPHAQHWPRRVTVGYHRGPLRFPWLLTLQSMGRACRRRPALLQRGRELVLQPGASLLVARHPPHCMQLYIAADANTLFFPLSFRRRRKHFIPTPVNILAHEITTSSVEAPESLNVLPHAVTSHSGILDSVNPRPSLRR
jgi:hypothetical protein